MRVNRLRRIAIGVAMAILAACLGACAALPSTCQLTIWPWPVDVVVPNPGDPAPEGVEPLIIPSDVNWSASTLGPDENGIDAVRLVLSPAAGARLADHSRGGVGSILVIGLNGRVVTTPMLAGPIDNGEILIQGSAADTLLPFAPCVGGG